MVGRIPCAHWGGLTTLPRDQGTVPLCGQLQELRWRKGECHLGKARDIGWMWTGNMADIYLETGSCDVVIVRQGLQGGWSTPRIP